MNTARSKPRVRAVILDVGGVLIHNDARNAVRQWEACHGLPPGALFTTVITPDLARRATLGQVSGEHLWRYVATRLDLTDAEVREAQRAVYGGERLDTTLTQFLQGLRPRYKTALLSNAWSETRAVLTGTFGLGAVVDSIILSAEEGFAKPDVRVYRLAARRLGVCAEEVVFVDDTWEHVQAARSAGMQGIWFTTAADTIGQIQDLLDQG